MARAAKRRTGRTESKKNLPAPKTVRLPVVKPNHKHTGLAMDFYEFMLGKRALPSTGIEIPPERFDEFCVERQMLPLADVPRDDPRFHRAQNDRDKARKKLNSGACCIDVRSDRQYQIEITRHKWLMLPLGDLAREKLNGLGDKLMRTARRAVGEVERYLTACMMTAQDEDKRKSYEFALHEIGYAKTSITAAEKNLTDRGRHIAAVLPGR